MCELEIGKVYRNRQNEIVKAVKNNNDLYYVKVLQNKNKEINSDESDVVYDYNVWKNGSRNARYADNIFDSFKAVESELVDPQDIVEYIDPETYPEFYI